MAAQVKGAVIVASLRYLRERFGEEPAAHVRQGLPRADRLALEGKVLASSWYPASLLLRFMEEAEWQLGSKQPELARHMGRASADYGLTTVYRVIFRLASPEFIVSRAASAFGRQWDTGKLAQEEHSRGRAVFSLQGFQGALPFCTHILGWMERTLELAGATDVRVVHASCLHRREAECRFEGTWS
ncbi:MAG TPA: DUF2378 family protein [Vicinamibacteria bacterium]|nr:DUF2378 family protein [Vicinamibacteria bacterium]